MSQLNYQVSVEGKSAEQVAKAFHQEQVCWRNDGAEL